MFISSFVFHCFRFFPSLSLCVCVENLNQNDYAQSKWNTIQVILATWLVIWGFIVFSIGTWIVHGWLLLLFMVCASIDNHRRMVNGSQKSFRCIVNEMEFDNWLYRWSGNCEFCYSFDRKFGFWKWIWEFCSFFPSSKWNINWYFSKGYTDMVTKHNHIFMTATITLKQCKMLLYDTIEIYSLYSIFSWVYSAVYCSKFFAHSVFFLENHKMPKISLIPIYFNETWKFIRFMLTKFWRENVKFSKNCDEMQFFDGLPEYVAELLKV